MMREQIRVLNDSYNGRTGGTNTGFGFNLAGITRTTNATWFTQMVTRLSVELEAKNGAAFTAKFEFTPGQTARMQAAWAVFCD